MFYMGDRGEWKDFRLGCSYILTVSKQAILCAFSNKIIDVYTVRKGLWNS